MSQKKVEMKKAQKRENKNYTAKKRKQNIIKGIAGGLGLIVLVFLIYLLVKPAAPDYSKVNTGTSAFDDAAIAQLAGADYDFSSLGTDLN